MPSRASILRRRAESKRAWLRSKTHRSLDDGAGCTTPEREEAIAMEASASDLAQAILARKLSAAEVAAVFIRRARALGGAEGGGVNALTDEIYDAAMARAQEIDAALAKGQVPAGSAAPVLLGKGYADDLTSAYPLLLGVPVSVKDHVDVAGTDSTTGCAAKCFKPRAKDALVVELLKDAGAVVFCKTNVPQMLMLPETANNVFGTTTNPWNHARCAGGSSGGEGALIGARASPLGIGTDIGGSIRIPATFNGITGFKPTPWRVSDQGITLPFLTEDRMGMQAVKLSAGPMARYVEDLVLMLKAWWVPKMWERDPFVVPLPFDDAVWQHGRGEEKTIRLGYFVTDGWFAPCRTAQRAVREAAAALEAAGGFELVPLELGPGLDGWAAASLFYAINAAEGQMWSYTQGLEGESVMEHYMKLYVALNLPDFLRPLFSGVFWLLGERRLRHTAAGLRRLGISTREYWRHCADLEGYKKGWLRLLEEKGLDGFLSPGSALPAFPHGAARQLECSCTYTFMLNLLHFPAGIVPVTRVREEEAVYPMEDLPPEQRDSIARAAARSMEGAAGLPMGVHVVTKPYQDELCLHVMKRLQDATGCFTRGNVPEMAQKCVCAPPGTASGAGAGGKAMV